MDHYRWRHCWRRLINHLGLIYIHHLGWRLIYDRNRLLYIHRAISNCGGKYTKSQQAENQISAAGMIIPVMTAIMSAAAVMTTTTGLGHAHRPGQRDRQHHCTHLYHLVHFVARFLEVDL